MTVEEIAQICHEANRVHCIANGDSSQPHWEDAAEWKRSSAVDGVRFSLNYPMASPSAQHDSWSRKKFLEGWTYGPVKDEVRKKHPCLVPYDQLPEHQKTKDKIFQGIVNALKSFL